MSHFSENANKCRVDFFKPSGKWYQTISVNFRNSDYEDALIHDAFKNALIDRCPNHFHGMTAICLDPHHKLSHPISLVWEGI